MQQQNHLPMHKRWQNLEHFNSRLVPVALLGLLIIIIAELFFPVENQALKIGIKIADGIIIAIFVVDLIFLAIHSKNTRFFFRNYWLDILAVFPFALAFEVVEQIYRSITAAERLVIGQALFHEGLEAEKMLKEGAKEGKLVKMLRAVPRGIRLMTKSYFFEEFRKRRSRNHKKIRRR